MREHTNIFSNDFRVNMQDNIEIPGKTKYLHTNVCARVYIQEAVLDIRFEHTYFVLYLFFATRPFTYIKTIIRLASYNDHLMITRHACTPRPKNRMLSLVRSDEIVVSDILH